MRALYDDGAAEAKDVTRDFQLELDDAPGAETALGVRRQDHHRPRARAARRSTVLGVGGLKFTATSPLPGGNVTPAFNARLAALAAWLPAPLLAPARRAPTAPGSRRCSATPSASPISAAISAPASTKREVRYLIDAEFARTAEDVLWRRTKLGLAMSTAEQAALAAWIARNLPS